MTDPPHDTIAVLQVPALLTVATTAQILDVSSRTVRRRIDDGTLPAVRDHDRTMIRADELRDYIDRLERIGQPSGRRRIATGAGRRDWLR